MNCADRRTWQDNLNGDPSDYGTNLKPRLRVDELVCTAPRACAAKSATNCPVWRLFLQRTCFRRQRVQHGAIRKPRVITLKVSFTVWLLKVFLRIHVNNMSVLIPLVSTITSTVRVSDVKRTNIALGKSSSGLMNIHELKMSFACFMMQIASLSTLMRMHIPHDFLLLNFQTSVYNVKFKVR